MEEGSPGAAVARVAHRRASLEGRRRRNSGGGTPAHIRALDSERGLGHAAIAPVGAAEGATAGLRSGSDGKTAFEADSSPWAMPSNRSPKKAGARGGAGQSAASVAMSTMNVQPQRPGTVALTSAAARLQTKDQKIDEAELHASLGAAGIERLNTHQRLIRKAYADRAQRKERQLQRAVCITALVIVVMFAVAVALVVIYQPGKAAHEPCNDVADGNCTRAPPK